MDASGLKMVFWSLCVVVGRRRATNHNTEAALSHPQTPPSSIRVHANNVLCATAKESLQTQLPLIRKHFHLGRQTSVPDHRLVFTDNTTMSQVSHRLKLHKDYHVDLVVEEAPISGGGDKVDALSINSEEVLGGMSPADMELAEIEREARRQPDGKGKLKVLACLKPVAHTFLK